MKKKAAKPKEDGAGELLYRAIRKDAFAKRVYLTRKNFHLPEDGVKTLAEEGSWFLSLTNTERRQLVKNLDSLMVDFRLPFSIYPRLEEYVVCAGRFSIFEKEYREICDMDQDHDIEEFTSEKLSPTEETWRKSGVAFVKMYIPESASLADVKSFLLKHWKDIKKLQLKQNKQPQKRIRKIEDKEMKEYIYELAQLDLKELRSMNNETSVKRYKSQIIADLIWVKYKEKASPEKITAIIHQYKELSKNN